MRYWATWAFDYMMSCLAGDPWRPLYTVAYLMTAKECGLCNLVKSYIKVIDSSNWWQDAVTVKPIWDKTKKTSQPYIRAFIKNAFLMGTLCRFNGGLAATDLIVCNCERTIDLIIILIIILLLSLWKGLFSCQLEQSNFAVTCDGFVCLFYK